MRIEKGPHKRFSNSALWYDQISRLPHIMHDHVEVRIRIHLCSIVHNEASIRSYRLVIRV
jgi:hypothetical protein